MIRFVDKHRDQSGVEAICHVLRAAVRGFITSSRTSRRETTSTIGQTPPRRADRPRGREAACGEQQSIAIPATEWFDNTNPRQSEIDMQTALDQDATALGYPDAAADDLNAT